MLCNSISYAGSPNQIYLSQKEMEDIGLSTEVLNNSLSFHLLFFFFCYFLAESSLLEGCINYLTKGHAAHLIEFTNLVPQWINNFVAEYISAAIMVAGNISYH